jgi:trehalose-6-phosphate synthase
VAARAAHHSRPSGVLAIGIDRIDYTKGLPHKLLAIEMLLDSGSVQPDEFRLVQVAVPSRTSIPIYRFLGHQIRETAARINSRFTRTDRQPVVDLVTEQLPPCQIAGLLRAADLAIVTPCRDGMNLVALEFSAINADRPTELILGSGAGAAEHIGDWCEVVDGTDVLAIAATIRMILRRPRPDRLERARHRARAATRLTSRRWTQSFMRTLTSAA